MMIEKTISVPTLLTTLFWSFGSMYLDRTGADKTP